MMVQVQIDLKISYNILEILNANLNYWIYWIQMDWAGVRRGI